MKVCPSCLRLYPDDSGFCPSDGQKLATVGEVSIPKDPKDPRVGSRVCQGRYEIFRTVADGGMGRVYQGMDHQAQRSVALKILHSDVANDDVAVERFKREFEISRTLSHPHIVEVLAFERTEDNSYALVMEYLEGEELRMYLKREKTLVPERVVRMVSQLALGLERAHAAKIVHRDLKPDNIFLCHTSDGDVSKVLDFGSVRDNSENAKKLTVMGTTIGSPFYMAPEQAQGLPSLDHRADVWSLAAIAYEALTGTVPFRGATGPAILLAILTQEPIAPSLVKEHQEVPMTLDLVMEEALTKNPDIRIKSVSDLADRIGQAFGLSGTHREWANKTQDELGALIAQGLPAALEKQQASDTALELSKMDAAMAAAQPAAFDGGPLAAQAAGGQPFAEDDNFVMGVPQGLPKWLVPAVAGTCVVVGVILAVLVLT